MERDLSLTKLVKMYLLNSWVIILVGMITAIGLTALKKENNEVTISNSAILVFDLEETEENNLTVKKTTYFDAYRSLLNGNILKESENFNENEKNRLNSINVSVEYSCYTITMRVPKDGNLENDQKILKKYISESEKWMQEHYCDDSISVDIVAENIVQEQDSDFIMLGAIGFVVGAVFVAMILFVWFVLDKKVRTEEDVVYYMDVECLGTLKRRG